MNSADIYTSYDRVTDILLYFTSEVTLKFVVQLAKNMKSGERRFFHYEVERQSASRGGITTKTINRNMNFFYTIDNKNDFGNSFVIRPQDAVMLLDVINKKVLPWFYADSKEYAFQYINDTLSIKEYTPAMYTQTDIRYLKFEPAVIIINEQYAYSINISVNGTTNFNVELEKFMGFVYFLNCDMYTAACSIVNYAKTEPYGIEIFKPYGLGGGQVEDKWGEDNNIQYSSTEIDSTQDKSRNNYKTNHNSFLDSI